MDKTYLHRPGLEIEADFSEEKPPLFRYRLSATKEGASEEPKTVCAIMQNPSYACVEFADKSVQVLERTVFEKKYEQLEDVERLIVVNQFAFIQTKDFKGTEEQIGVRNKAAIANALDEADIVLIAWGKDNGFKEIQEDILGMVREHKGKLLLQTSRHPSRVIYDGFIKKYYT
ncbi:DUF1643 domain-containing protein [Thermodesulfobacteriota bacterium]